MTMGLTLAEAQRLGIGHEHPESPERRTVEASARRAEAGRWTLEIPGWRPATANELMRGHRLAAHKRKVADAKRITAEAALADVPPATGKRLVRIVVTNNSGRPLDPDSILKSGLDALVRSGLILDDSAEHCEWVRPDIRRGPKGTVILLEDIGDPP